MTPIRVYQGRFFNTRSFPQCNNKGLNFLQESHLRSGNNLCQGRQWFATFRKHYFKRELFQKGVFQITPSKFSNYKSHNGSLFHFSKGCLTLRFIVRAMLLWQQKGKTIPDILTNFTGFTDYPVIFLNEVLEHSSIGKLFHLQSKFQVKIYIYDHFIKYNLAENTKWHRMQRITAFGKNKCAKRALITITTSADWSSGKSIRN